jgi:hypothetical protein
MCQFLSAIVTRQGNVYCNPLTDSHEDLIEIFGIKDTKPMQNFVRVEFTPETTTDMVNVEKYKLRVDEPSTPNWFDNELREKTIDRLKAILNKMIITEDRKILIGDAFIIDHAKIDSLRFGRVVAQYGGTVNKVLDGGTVNKVLDGGTVNKVLDGGTVNEVLDGGTVNEVLDGGTVNEVWDGGTVNEVLDGGTVNGKRKE